MADLSEFPAQPSCVGFSALAVVDARGTKPIGKRYIEGRESVTVPVTVTTDLKKWVGDGAAFAVHQGGAATQKQGKPVLRLTIERIETNENVLHRSGYDGKILLAADLLKEANGSVCWSTRVDGVAQNYGYSGSAEAYDETLNHALDRAMIRILSLPEFRDAVCSCQ
jgi:hypothetical protein